MLDQKRRWGTRPLSPDSYVLVISSNGYVENVLVNGRRAFKDTSIHLPKPKGGVSAGQFESYTQVVVGATETP